MTPADRQKLRELCAKATEGPWEHCSSGLLVEAFDLIPREVSPTGPDAGAVALVGAIDDAELIAAARDAIPALLDEVERLERELATARETVAEKRARLPMWERDPTG